MIKQLIARIPFAIVIYKILKNIKHMSRTFYRTRGPVHNHQLDPDTALAYVRKIIKKVDRFLDDAGGWQRKHVLELGPGDTLGTGFLALARGASSYTALDRFPVIFDTESERRIYLRLAESLTPEERARVEETLEFSETGYKTRDDRFKYFNSIPIEEAPLRFPKNSFDLIFSNAVLEHVADVRATFEAMNSLLVPGGLMVHEIDFRSHQRFENHRLQFLEYPSLLWKMMTSHTGEPNRVRVPAYREIMSRIGLVDIRIDLVEQFDKNMIREVRPRLSREFRHLSDEELSPAICLISARSPGEGGAPSCTNTHPQDAARKSDVGSTQDSS